MYFFLWTNCWDSLVLLVERWIEVSTLFWIAGRDNEAIQFSFRPVRLILLSEVCSHKSDGPQPISGSIHPKTLTFLSEHNPLLLATGVSPFLCQKKTQLLVFLCAKIHNQPALTYIAVSLRHVPLAHWYHFHHIAVLAVLAGGAAAFAFGSDFTFPPSIPLHHLFQSGPGWQNQNVQ